MIAIPQPNPTSADLEPLIQKCRKYLYATTCAEQQINISRARAGQALLALRRAVEAQGIDWWPWWRASILHGFKSRADTEKLMKMAASQDAEAAHEVEKEVARHSMRELRSSRISHIQQHNSKALPAGNTPAPPVSDLDDPEFMTRNQLALPFVGVSLEDQYLDLLEKLRSLPATETRVALLRRAIEG